MKLIKDTTVKEYLKRVIFGADQKIDGWVDAMPEAKEAAAFQADLDFYKRRVCELCGVCPDEGDPDNCEIAGHGEWKPGREISRDYTGNHCDAINYSEWSCSICGYILKKPWNPEYNYCPNCGAKMGAKHEAC
jgi:rubrerythrin